MTLLLVESEEVSIPELTAAQSNELTRTVSRNSTNKRDVTRTEDAPPQGGSAAEGSRDGIGERAGKAPP